MMEGAAGGIMALGGGIASGYFGGKAAKAQMNAMRDAIEYQKMIDQRTYADLAPYRDFGKTQLNDLSSYMTNKNPEDFIDPGYDFRFKSGQNAVAGNAAAAGMLQSGDTLRALTQYGQDMGSQEYGNAFSRWLNEGQFRQGLAGMGQNAAVQNGYVGGQMAGNVGNLTAQTDWGGRDRPWADIGSAFMGTGLGMMANGAKSMDSPGGANMFASMMGG